MQDQEAGATGQPAALVKFMSMSAMQQFRTPQPEKSHEEIRYEDYSQGVKGNTVGALSRRAGAAVLLGMTALRERLESGGCLASCLARVELPFVY